MYFTDVKKQTLYDLKQRAQITQKGYKIPFMEDNAIVVKIINDVKKELMVIPYCENAVRFPVFRISDKYLYMPKYYGISKFGNISTTNIKEQEGIPFEYNFKGKLRDYQVETCNLILKHLQENQSGLASIYTGWGKTCAAIWICSQLGRKTLIVVHTENLLNQWKERLTDFLGVKDDEIGIIQGPKTEIDNKKICIGMLQSISMKDYSSDTFKSIGFTIFDESHHLGARIFSRIFYKVGSKYNLGLSATLTRADGLTKVIKYFLGDIIVSLKLSILTPNVLLHYTSIEPLEEKKMINGKANMPGMINDLCASFMRNLEIVNIIKQKYNEGRKILILSDRRNHCNEMRRMLNDEEYINNSGLYYGGMKNEALQLSNTKRIIFATYHIASEGYDNPDLDTLIFASPKTKIEQAVGRILRKENKNEPEVIDIVDAWSVFNNLYFSRLKFYKRKKYDVIGNSNTFDNQEQNIILDKFEIINID